MDKETPPWLQPVPAEEQTDSILSGDKSMLFIAGGAIVLVILFVAVIMMIYSGDEADRQPVRVSAPNTPIKERPENVGGMAVDHQDKQVFDRSGDNIPSTEMKLKGQAEEPLKTLPEEQVAVDAEKEVEDSAFSRKSRDNRINEVVAATEKAVAPEAVKQTPVPAPKAKVPSAATADMTGKYMVQLGAFGSREGAEKSAHAASRKFKDALKGLTPIFEPVNTGDRTLYRLRFGPLNTRSEVDRICLVLSEKGQGCMAVNP